MKRLGAGKKSVVDVLNDRLRRREEGERCDKRHSCDDRKDRGFSSDENDEDWERPSTEQPDSWGGSRGTTFSLELLIAEFVFSHGKIIHSRFKERLTVFHHVGFFLLMRTKKTASLVSLKLFNVRPVS